MPGQDGPVSAPMKTVGFGQDSYQVPVGQEYNLGITNPGQDAQTRMGSLSDLAMQNPDSWYLDPQARATPEAQDAFKTAFNKGPADKNSWLDWAKHIQKFYGIEQVAQMAGQGWFNRFNMSPEEQEQLGRHIASAQDRGDDPLFGNTGITIPGAIMTLGGLAVGGAAGWAGATAGGAAGGAVGADALAGGEGVASGAGMPPAVADTAAIAGMSGPAAAGTFAMPAAVPESGATLSAFPSAAAPAAGFDPGSDFGRGSVDTSGFGGDFDISGFADSNFAAGGDIFTPNFKGDMGMPGYGYTTPGMAGEGGIEEWLKKMGLGKLVGKGGALPGYLSVGSGLYGMYQANQMSKLSKQAMDRSDPFGPERAQYAAKLRELYADPSAVEKLPGYKAGLNAVERKMASQGYNNSGNMMLALHDYGGKMFDSEAKRLSELSGAAMQPNAGPAVSAAASANALRSQSLASMAFGSRYFF